MRQVEAVDICSWVGLAFHRLVKAYLEVVGACQVEDLLGTFLAVGH